MGEVIKGILEKINLFILFQFIWLIEFYFLALLAGKDVVEFFSHKEIIMPHIIEDKCNLMLSYMSDYDESIFLLAVIFLLTGVAGSFLNYIPFISDYKLIRIYSDFGLYAGGWVLLMELTYQLYILFGKVFLLVPVGVCVIYNILKKWKEKNDESELTFR